VEGVMQDINSISSDNKFSFSPQEEVFTKKLVALLLKQVQRDIDSKKIDINKSSKKERA